VQDATLANVLAEYGIDGLFRLAAASRIPRIVGVAAGTLPESDTRETRILMRGCLSTRTSQNATWRLGWFGNTSSRGVNIGSKAS
jgi:hypothetical protein